MVGCSKCNRQAVICLAYSRTNLCRKHFTDGFERRFNRTVREFGLVKKGDRIGVALSGGNDSVVVLHLLKKIADQMRVKLVAVSLDEGIKGCSGLEAAIGACRKLGVEHKIYSYKKEIGFTIDEMARERKRTGTCTCCRVFRSWMLDKAARELELNKMAVGYNLDDAAQASLMNILGGKSTTLAKSGIAEEEMSVDVIRPLVRTPGKEVAVYAAVERMGANSGECPYSKDAFSKRVGEFLDRTEERFPGTKFKVFNSFMSMGALGKGSGSRKRVKCSKCGELSSKKVCARCLILDGISPRLTHHNPR